MSIWTAKQRERYEVLSQRSAVDHLTEDEAEELASLVGTLDDYEASYLAPAAERKGRAIEELTAAVERIEKENRRLSEYLRERRAFLERVKSTLAEIEAEDRSLRARYAEVLSAAGDPSAPSSNP